ncbi:hypothetical protein D3C75_949050 [compost metagenome]
MKIDQLLYDVQNRVRQQLLVPFRTGVQHLRLIVNGNQKHDVRRLRRQLQIQKFQFLSQPCRVHGPVTDKRHQKLLAEQGHALGELHLHLLHQETFLFLRLQILDNPFHYFFQLRQFHRLKDIIHRIHLQR